MLLDSQVETSCDFPECKQFTGRLKQICRCEADIPLDGPSSINAYRASYGLKPITEIDVRKKKTTKNPHPQADGTASSKNRDLVISPAETSHGPGTVLTSLFAKFGFKSIDDPIDHETASALAGVVKPGCGGCQELAMQMDAWGPDGCESHIDEIIDGIRRRASQRPSRLFGTLDRMPLFDTTCRIMVRHAIKVARHKYPGTVNNQNK